MSIGSTQIQTPASVSRVANFYQVGNGQALDCTTSSARIAFVSTQDGIPASDILLFNSGTVNVFVAFGDSTVTALGPVNGTPANGMVLGAGSYLVFNKGINTYIAAVTASSTATVYFYQGYGS